MDLEAIRRAHRAGDGRPTTAFTPTGTSSRTPAPPGDRRTRPRRRWVAGWSVAVCTVLGLVVWQLSAHTPPSTFGNDSPPACNTVSATALATGTAADGVDSQGATITYSADNLLDGDTTTAWRTNGTGVGEIITLRFDRLCQLTTLRIVDGYSKTDPGDNTDRWRQNRRVSRFTITTDHQQDATLDPNERDWQTLSLPPSNVEAVELEIRESAPRKTDRDFTAISEIRVN